jgi:HD-GYP domain-containing protein (c-di-GMP phosphodiesterase class II)
MVRLSDLVREQPGKSSKGAAHIRREKNIDLSDRFAGKPPEEAPGVKPEDSAKSANGKTQPTPINGKPPGEASGVKPEDSAKSGPNGETQPTPKVVDPVLPLQPERTMANHPVTAGGKELYAAVHDYMAEFRQQLLNSGKGIGPDRSLRLVDEITTSPSLIEELYPLTLLSGHNDPTFIDHSVNNMIYSLKLGMGMNHPRQKLIGLALSALHHDIGMFLVPEAILTKKQRLTPAELAEVQKHPGSGRNLLRAYDSIDPEISRAVYEHHEREGMQGYPEGIGNSKICVYAKIIGICDSYEAMTHDRPHRKAMEQYISVLELVETKDLLYDRQIVKVFLDVITLYPTGSYVRLNNGAIGVVVSTSSANPFKPKVRIIVDGNGNRISDETVCDLSMSNILSIVTGVPADEVSA